MDISMFGPEGYRMPVDLPKVRPLAACCVMSWPAHIHTVDRNVDSAAAPLSHVQRYVFTKAGIERAMIHITRIELQALRECILLSLDMENAFNTIFRRSFLAEL
jgi:hypothetical protein